MSNFQYGLKQAIEGTNVQTRYSKHKYRTLQNKSQTQCGFGYFSNFLMEFEPWPLASYLFAYNSVVVCVSKWCVSGHQQCGHKPFFKVLAVKPEYHIADHVTSPQSHYTDTKLMKSYYSSLQEVPILKMLVCCDWGLNSSGWHNCWVAVLIIMLEYKTHRLQTQSYR